MELECWGSFKTLFRLCIVMLIANFTEMLAGIVDRTAESLLEQF